MQMLSNDGIRPLTTDEVKRFESAEQQERKIQKSYGKYGEHDSIQEGKWIMVTGQFANSFNW